MFSMHKFLLRVAALRGASRWHEVSTSQSTHDGSRQPASAGRMPPSIPQVRLPPANRTATTVLALLRCPFVNDHPRRPKLVAQHGKTASEERLLHRHKGLATIGKESKNTLGFAGRVHGEG